MLNFKNFLIFVATLLCGGCSLEARLNYDLALFRSFGGTVFTSPHQATAKELHLDSGTLQGKLIIVQGEILEIGHHGTHVILSDSSATMLVVTTLFGLEENDLAKWKGRTLRVLGTLERGKKGLPFVLAQGFSLKI